MKIIITESQLKKLVVRKATEKDLSQLDELDYESFHSDENLSQLRDAIDRNKMVSVAFVKKNGSVKHMLIRKNLSSYIGSAREKTDAQMNVESNHNLKKVVDINAYKRELRNLRNMDPQTDEVILKQKAAKVAWRSVNLENVLGFMAGGQFIDLRDENNIRDRFGEDVYNSITRSMVNAMAQQEVPAPEEVTTEPDNLQQGI